MPTVRRSRYKTLGMSSPRQTERGCGCSLWTRQLLFRSGFKYQTRNVAEGIANAFPEASEAVQKGTFRFCGTQFGTQTGNNRL